MAKMPLVHRIQVLKNFQKPMRPHNDPAQERHNPGRANLPRLNSSTMARDDSLWPEMTHPDALEDSVRCTLASEIGLAVPSASMEDAWPLKSSARLYCGWRAVFALAGRRQPAADRVACIAWCTQLQLVVPKPP